MRQLITRIDDELHARLRWRAKAEGRSMNALVTEILSAGVGAATGPQAVRERARAAGLLVEPPPPHRVLPRARVVDSTRGTGRAVSKALQAERSAR